MTDDLLQFLREFEAVQRTRAGASSPLPFVYIDHANHEGYMNYGLVSARKAVLAGGRITMKQIRRAAKERIVVLIVVFPKLSGGSLSKELDDLCRQRPPLIPPILVFDA